MCDAAKAGQLILVKCNLCRRAIYFLASDLVNVLNPDNTARNVPFPCSKCGKTDYINVTLRFPAMGDYGHLKLRRPDEVKHIQTWRTVTLGDP
uniref:hypothetical protein n=1 Tax=Pararhizobium sp. IMCC3301 TaxID=3067904 RepID=UPI002741B87E|nr:hypothetical protein [Pararhizobium sp. IMCC3301]